jgi:hypothetical protein
VKEERGSKMKRRQDALMKRKALGSVGQAA